MGEPIRRMIWVGRLCLLAATLLSAVAVSCGGQDFEAGPLGVVEVAHD